MLFTALSLVFVAATAPVPQEIEINVTPERQGPIYLLPEEKEQARARMENEDWATEIGKGYVNSATKLVNADLDIPRTGGQWSHWYTCKEDGGRLKAENPTRHVCQSCRAVYTGYPYDEVYVTFRHSHWMRGIETLGTAYALDPKPEFAARVREILLEYASFYESLPLHDFKNGKAAKGARLYAQTLDESVTLCSLIFGYDLVYDADCFSAEDHEIIATHLLRPMVDTILRYKAGKSNWQSWHNAGIAATGFLLGDQAMVDFAINDPQHGFLYQMRESVLPSGMWYEGAPSYHWYAMKAHLYLLEAAVRKGVDLYALPVVHSLFEGPTKPLYPDMTYPPINDSSRSSIKGAAVFYEVAYRRYGDPNFLALRTPRKSPYAVLWGQDVPDGTEAAPLQLATSNDPEDGLAILRDASGETALFFNYSPGTSGHTHAAKLDILLYAHGDQRVVDPGRLSYGNPLHREWYTQTVAHNTVVVDQMTQKRASGRLIDFQTGDGWSMTHGALDGGYEGVTLERALVMRKGVIVDIVQGRSEVEHTYDLPLHVNGTLAGLPTGTPTSLGEKQGYQHLKDLHALENNPGTFTIDTGKSRAIHVTLLDDAALFVGEGRAQPATKYIPVVMRRLKGASAQFVAVYQILGAGESPATVSYDRETVRVGDTTVATALDGFTVAVDGTTVYPATNP